jgi:hypothetical protein
VISVAVPVLGKDPHTMKLELRIPISATTTQNSRMHWSQRARRVEAEHNAVIYAWSKARPKIEPTTRITLTRFGPRELDGDNLQGSLKGIRDAIAKKLKIDDGSKLVEWVYRQEIGEYEVVALVERVIA